MHSHTNGKTIHKDSGAGKVAAPTLSRAKLKFKIVTIMHAKTPKPLCKVYMWKNQYLHDGIQKHVVVLTHQIDISRKPKRAH